MAKIIYLDWRGIETIEEVPQSVLLSVVKAAKSQYEFLLKSEGHLPASEKQILQLLSRLEVALWNY